MAVPAPGKAMSTHYPYALTSHIEANRLLRRWTSVSRSAFFAANLLADVVVVVMMSWITGVGYHLVAYGAAGDSLFYLEVGLLAAIIFVLPNLARREYALQHFFDFRPLARRAIHLWNATSICLLTLGFLTQVTVVYSRGWILIYYVTTIGVLLAQRWLFFHATVIGSKSGLLSAQRIFLFGTGRHVEEFVTRHQLRNLGINVVGCNFVTPLEPGASPAQAAQMLDRDLEAVVASARLLEPDAVFLVMPWSDAAVIERCVEALLKLPAEIHLGTEHILHRFEHVTISRCGSMASLQLTRPPLTLLELLAKRACDLVLASVGLLLATPFVLIAAIAIKLDSSGPVFFLQRRHGFNQKPFRIIKLRTMRTMDDGPVIHQARRDDPRITRVGAFLRRCNIDELPQLLNVIMGDMSLVGPRPHALSHDQEFEQRIALYARRHNVKPGITGWAQIHGLRGETDTDEKMLRRVELDLFYIDNWSLMLDVQILLRTVLSRSSYCNAY